MYRLILLISLAPCVLTFFIAKFFGVKRIARGCNLPVSGERIATSVLQEKGINLVVKRSWWLGLNPLKKGTFYLSEPLAKSTSVEKVAQVLHLCGLALLQTAHEKSVKQRYRAVRFASVFPIFVILAVVFGKLARAGSFRLSWAITIVVISLALSCIALLINLAVEKEAARRATKAMEKSNLVPRMRDRELLEEAILGHAYISVLPSMFHVFLTKGAPKRKKSEAD